MASLRKVPNSKYWIACYTDHTGKQRQKSTKETDRRRAQKIADKLESAYQQTLTEAQVRKLLSEAYEEIHGDRLLSASAEDFFSQWLKRKEVETAPATWHRYQSVIKRFINAIGEKRGKDLVFITGNDLTHHRDNLARELSISSANTQLKILRSAFQDALRGGLVESNPAALVPVIKRKGGTANERRAFTLPELKKVLEVANDEWQGIILTALYTGQRLGDIVRLTWNSVDVRREEIALTTVKTGRRIILPMAKPLLDYFLTLPSQDNLDSPVFPSAFAITYKQGRTGSLSNQFYSILVSAGLAPPRTHNASRNGRSGKRKGNALSFHCLRHTATSLLKNAGVSEAVAMDIIGHDSKAVSANYTHIEVAAKRKAVNALPDITSR